MSKKSKKEEFKNGIDSCVIRVSHAVLGEIEKRSEHWREPIDSILRRQFKLPQKVRKNQKEA